MKTFLVQRAQGVICGGAVGDALGGPTETRLPTEILDRYEGWVEGIVPPFDPDWRVNRPLAPYHKGDGHITDDTLMVMALINVYTRKRDHLDAYDISDLLIDELTQKKTFIPELGEEAPIARRLALAERYLLLRLSKAHVDPREAGVGNAVNCGAAMYMAPVGVINAGAPEAAYREAIDIAGAHQSSFGREAAGVLAAAVAESMREGATVDSVIQVACELAKDGTAQAIKAVADVAAQYSDWRKAIKPLRQAMAPYDTAGEDYRNPGLNAYRPSRLHTIEELPIALGMLIVARGDYVNAVLGSVNYGRDSDSIAGMAGAIAGGLGGINAIPLEWLDHVERVSQKDFRTAANSLADVAQEIFQKDRERWQRREEEWSRLVGNGEKSVAIP